MNRSRQTVDDTIYCDVIIVGAGPVGLAMANVLGKFGVDTVVLERLETLIDYPRGVGIDDESLRTVQALGLVDRVLEHVTPNHAAHFYSSSFKLLASFEPAARPFGWSRRNAFLQPLVDVELLRGLERYPSVSVKFGFAVERVDQDGDGVVAKGRCEGSGEFTIRAKYLVGADGGRSSVRDAMDVTFEGVTSPDPFLVVDVANDPIGIPNLHLICDHRFPYVSIALPHGVRRLEFKVDPKDIVNEVDVTEEFFSSRMEMIKPGLKDAQVIRRRVYYHSARIASTFRDRRLFLAGDAAHLMPVWQGQGYNSGLRDAANLAWKLAFVAHGKMGDDLLDTYDQERRDHARAMIDLSVLTGRFFAPRSRLKAAMRDVFFSLLGLWPAASRYIKTMAWKPIPKLKSQALLTNGDSPVGSIFFQPEVQDRDGNIRLLDDILELGFAVVSWGYDPSAHVDDAARRLLETLNARIVVVCPAVQRTYINRSSSAGHYVFDHTGALKTWFDGQRKGSVIVLRPDRFIAAICQPGDLSQTIKSLARNLDMRGS